MNQLLQLVVQGIAVGAVYSLVALGLVLSYKATEVLNFAHGDLLMFSAFLGWWFIGPNGMNFWPAIGLVICIVALLGYALEAGLMRRIAGRPQYAGVMLTIGIGFMIRGATSLWLSPQSRSFDTPWTGKSINLAGTVVGELHVVILASAVCITAALYTFLRFSRAGIAIQAAAQNQLAAYLTGVRVKRMSSIVWAISAAIAAVCGMLLAPITYVDLALWLVVLKAFAALVLGGFGSIPGAILGGILIGLIEQLSGLYLPDGLKSVMPYLVLIGVLVVYPRGLLGESHGRRV
jgi:branched-chain amino acid transport system permease protein